jgi:hypothetical protein
MNRSGLAFGPRPQPIATVAYYVRPIEMPAWALGSGLACGRNQPSRHGPAGAGVRMRHGQSGHCLCGGAGNDC